MNKLPLFTVEPNNLPAASWADDTDIRHLIARFLGSEVHQALSNADAFLGAIQAVRENRLDHWEWNGNSYSVRLGGESRVIEDHYPDLGGDQQSRGELSLDDFAS